MDKERRSSEPDRSQPNQKSGEQHPDNIDDIESEYSATSEHDTPATAEYADTIATTATHPGPATAAEDLADYILHALAPEDESLTVNREFVAPAYVKISVSCDQVNTGRLIGRGGKTINAIRTLVRSIAQLHGKRIDIEIAT